MKQIRIGALAIAVLAASAVIGFIGPQDLVRGAAEATLGVRASGLARKAERCLSLGQEDRIACFDDVLLRTARKGEIRLAMAGLERLVERSDAVDELAHGYAHAIGMAAVDGGHDPHESLKACSALVDAGCYHGVMQIALGRAPKIDSDVVNGLCARYFKPNSNPWFRYQCAHGIGHGLTMHHAYDLPVAIRGCDLLRQEVDQRACVTGVMMENRVSFDHGRATPVTHALHSHAEMPDSSGSSFPRFDPKNAHYPCSVLPQKYLKECYHSQPALVLTVTGLDYAAAIRMCDTAPAEARVSCYHGLGNQIAAQAATDLGEAHRLCGMAAPGYRPWCYDGIVKSRLSFTGNETEAVAFCARLDDGPDRTQCHAALGWQLLFMGKPRDVRAAVCALPRSKDATACRFGAGLDDVEPEDLPSGVDSMASAGT